MGNNASKTTNSTHSSKPEPVLASDFELQRKKYIKKEVTYHELIVFGYLRGCAGRRDMSIHYDLMRHITTMYRPVFEFTKWSSHHGLINCYRFDNDGHLITRTESSLYDFSYDYRYMRPQNVRRNTFIYILAHYSNLVCDGIHCWRIFVKMADDTIPDGNIFFAVSSMSRFVYDSARTANLNQKGSNRLFGVSNNNWMYSRRNNPNIVDNFDLLTNYHNNVYEYQVDILLDCDNNILRFCVVEQLNDTNEYVIWNLPQHNNGWIPHIQTSNIGLQLRIAKISAKWYGITYKDKYEK
eukprot:479400_1